MTDKNLKEKNAELSRRLEEAEEALHAIRDGTVDAFVAYESSENRVYTLEGADRPYRLLVEKMQQGAATLYADGTIVYCNLGLANLLKVPHEKLIGQPLHDFFQSYDRDIFDNLLWQGQTRSGQGEARLQRTDGESVPVYLTFNVLPKECGAAIGVLVTDLTAQKHQEELATAHRALQASEARLQGERERLRVTISSIADAIIATDSEGRITTLNPVAEVLTGWKQDEAVGQPLLKVYRIISEETREPVEDPVRKVLAIGKKGMLSNNNIIIRKDGTECAIDDSAAQIRDDKGQIVGVVLVFRDISERRKAETALKQADQIKNEFLAMLSHELRNPLAPIRSAAEIMRVKKYDAAYIQEASEMIERQVAQMARLIDDLMDVSRITRGKIELRRQRIELVTAAHQAVEAARPLMLRKKHELTVTLPSERIYLNADLTRLTQVIGNLLNNSCKFTPKGGHISLTVELEKGSSERAGREVASLSQAPIPLPLGCVVNVRVRDDGIGIAAELLPSIFDMFTQLDKSLDRPQSGLGIGLALVKTLVEMHGGTVEARSPGLDQGCELTVRLPFASVEICRAIGAPDDSTDLANCPPASARRILIVDDNIDGAEVLGMFLTLNGNETHSAHDGLEALEAAATFLPHVILLDIGLPKLNGYEVARKIREQPWGKSTVLVAMTGWGEDEDRKQSRVAGFNAHLVKPLDPTKLSKFIDDINTAISKGAATNSSFFTPAKPPGLGITIDGSYQVTIIAENKLPIT